MEQPWNRSRACVPGASG